MGQTDKGGGASRGLREIRDIKWAGNHFQDAGHFQKIGEFLRGPAGRDEKVEALTVMVRDGMGIDDPVDAGQLDAWLKEDQ